MSDENKVLFAEEGEEKNPRTGHSIKCRCDDCVEGLGNGGLD